MISYHYYFHYTGPFKTNTWKFFHLLNKNGFIRFKITVRTGFETGLAQHLKKAF